MYQHAQNSNAAHNSMQPNSFCSAGNQMQWNQQQQQQQQQQYSSQMQQSFSPPNNQMMHSTQQLQYQQQLQVKLRSKPFRIEVESKIIQKNYNSSNSNSRCTTHKIRWWIQHIYNINNNYKWVPQLNQSFPMMAIQSILLFFFHSNSNKSVLKCRSQWLSNRSFHIQAMITSMCR